MTNPTASLLIADGFKGERAAALAVEHLKIDEGFRAHPYQDTRSLAIGYGFRLPTPHSHIYARVEMGDSGLYEICYDEENCSQNISEYEATFILEHWVRSIWARLYTHSKTEVSFAFLSEERQAILCCMVYNLGMSGCLKFKKMWKAIGENDFELASKEMLNSKWAKQLPNRANKYSKAFAKNK